MILRGFYRAVAAVGERLEKSFAYSSDGENHSDNEADNSSAETPEIMNFTVNRILSEPMEAFFAQACSARKRLCRDKLIRK